MAQFQMQVRKDRVPIGLLGAVALTTTLAGVSSPAKAVSFNFSYDEGTTLEQIVGFEMAGNIWSRYLQDDVTLNLHVGVSSDLPGKAVGGALPGMQAYQSYEGFYDAIQQDRTSASDYTAASHLQANRYSDGHLRYEGMFESGSTWHNKNITLTNANAKALGLLDQNNSALDGTILMGDLKGNGHKWNYDYGRDQSKSNGSLDFLSVALHEIGHNLGFVSGIDSAMRSDRQATYSENIDRLMKTTSLDMFRFSDYSEERGKVDLASGVRSYFSIDGGDTNLADFARGKKDLGLGSDGFQGSHWKDQNNNQLGIMGPTIRRGEQREVKTLDLQALDVIGWDINYNASFDLTTLETEAKQRVSQKMADHWGWDEAHASWIDHHIGNGENQLVGDWLSQDRDDDVSKMIQDSQVYEMGFSEWWQEAFWQNAYNSTLSESDAVAVPEPSTVGFLGLAAFALKYLRHKQKAS
ncbi:MAG: NF038122 family metalloprotease [Cyanobacteria bacterium J06621_11]